MIIGYVCQYCWSVVDATTVVKLSTLNGTPLESEQICDDCIPILLQNCVKKDIHMEITDEIKSVDVMMFANEKKSRLTN